MSQEEAQVQWEQETEELEDGFKVSWWCSDYGNVLKGDERKEVYLSFAPMTVKLGPFESLEEAKRATVESHEELKKLAEEYNDDLLKRS